MTRSTLNPRTGLNQVAADFSRQTGKRCSDSAIMKKSIPIRSTRKLCALLSAVTLCCAMLPHIAQAVFPPPDGGYSGGNTAEGALSLLNLNTGHFNTAIGAHALRENRNSNYNTAVGAGALLSNTAERNTATGTGALLSNTTGITNTANGAFSLFFNTAGTGNTAIGLQALFSNNIGSYNTAIGFDALINSTGGGNIALGASAGESVTTADNVICIGSPGGNVSDSCFIGNIRDVTTNNADAVPVVIDSAGQLGTVSSSRRFKKDIEPMDKASETLFALNPVTFHYKNDKTNTPQFGLVAEEVAKVNPDLVVRDKNGRIYSVRYDAINAMLLNEFLKEHKKVQNLEAAIAQQRKDFQAAIAQQAKMREETAAKQHRQIQALTAVLKEQAAQIQRVTAQVELNKTESETVARAR
jgi:hypothetical protein